MNLINMRRITVISFLKTIFSYLADIFSHRTISVSEAIILRLTKKPYLMFRYLPVIVVFLLPGLSGMENTVYGQGCNPALTGCPGDIVVNVQPNTCGNNVTWLPPSMITPCPGNTVTSNFAPGDFFNAGTTQVIYYSWSGTEKKDSCKFNVIVVDNQKPVVVTKNANLYISQSGTAILNSSDINNGSSDNCSLTLIPGRTIFTCSDVGLTIPVALTGTDPSGNSSTSTAQVTVHDTTRPVINTREFSLLLDNNGTGSLSASDIDNGTYDNCGPVTLSVTPTSFSCPDQGSKKVTFTAADSHGNIAVKDVWITVNSSLKINSVSLSNCDAAGTYALFNSNVSGGSGSYFYFWDCLDDAVNPFVQEIAVYPYVTFVNTSTKITPFFNNNIPDGNYTIRLVITDGNGCSDTAEMIIVKTGPVYSNITRRSSTACEGSTVTYTVNPDPVATFDWQVTNGTILSSPPYTNSVNVQWNMGVTFGVVTATLSKTNLMGQPCSSTVTDSVSIDLLPPPVFSNPVLNACLGSEETYTVTVPYQAYEWIVTGGLVTGGGSGNNFVKVRWSPVPAGKVTVIVSTVTGCSASAYVDVNINNLAGSILSVTDITCNGAANGMVSAAAATGTGVAPYEYSLDGGAYQVSGNFVNIAPGPHFVRIRDAVLCTLDLGFNITQPLVLVASVNKVDVTCFGGFTGVITAAGSGGTSPYEYSLNSSAFQPSGAFSGLPAGLHTLNVRDANNCPFTQKIIILQPDAVSGSALVTTPVKCFGGTATVTITGSGGTAPLSYTFNGVTNSTGVFPGIPAGSSYSWSITDANSCGPFTGTLGVTQPAALTGSASVTTAILCNGGTGTVTLTGSGGTAPLSYTFNGVTNTTGIFNGIAAGAGYPWSITDANGCGPVTGTLPVTEPAIITGSAAVTVPVLCNGGTATVKLTGGGGTAPLSYTFNGVTNTTGIFSGIAAGTGYIWNITDVNNCTPVTGTIDIGEPSAISGSASVSEEIICYGGTATVTITGSGGTAPLSYTFNGVTNATGIFPGITAGNAYSWSITDANNCGPLTGNIDVNQPDLLTAIAEVINPVPCPGGTATVKIIPSGGIAPYSFTFNGVTNATGIFSGIASGTGYVWSINDGNTCGPVVGTLDITEPLIITGTATVTNPVPCTGGTATVTITGSGGTEPYSFTFNGITNTSGIFSGISPGTGYQWIVNDINGCTPASGTLDITEPEIISGTISVTSPIVCNGSTTTVILTGNGGTIPLIYTFNGISNATGIFTEIHAGTAYQWSITDVNSCNPVTGIIDITEPPALTGTITFQSNVTVTGGNDGIVTVEGYGGTPPYLYSLNGSSFQVSGTFSSLTAGNYTVRIQDAALCEVDVPVSITDPSVPLSGTLVSKTDVSCFGGADGSLTVTGIAGIGTYEYSMNGTDFQASGTFNNLKAGTYIITIRDEKPATFPVTVDITEPETAVTVTTTGMNNLCNGDNTGSVIAVASGGTGQYEFSWNTSPVQMNDTASLLPAGTYEVTVTDANGCIAVGDVTISGPPALVLNLSATEADCPDTNDGSIILTISGGTAPYLTLWQDGNESQNRTELLPGNYTVTVTDDNGCAAMATAAVGFTGTFGCVEIPQIITPNNDGFNDEWRIRNIDLYPGAEVLVYTRWGKLVYKSRNISADPWDGRFNGRLMPTDSYHYILYLNDGSKPRSGVISIIR